MNRPFYKLPKAALLLASLAFVGCLGEEDYNINSGSGSQLEEIVIPDNSTVNENLFAVLNLENEALSAAKGYFESEQYYLAAKAVQEYYRNRKNVPNANVNLIAPTVSEEEQNLADWALQKTEDKKDGYRFHVEGYSDGDKPYSYQSSNSLKWDARISKAEPEESYRLHRMDWIVAQGKAYRTSLDEKYPEGFFKVLENWIENFPLPAEPFDYGAGNPATDEAGAKLYAWRPADVACRLDNLMDAFYYFMQSASFTPQHFADFLSSVNAQAEYLENNLSLEPEANAVQSHVLFRVGRLFPELKAAAGLIESSGGMNEGLDPAVFEKLNLENNELHKVKAAYEMGDYYAAYNELHKFFISRENGRNPGVDVNNVSATATEKNWAEKALKENGYRFYVKNYLESDNTPYSYLNTAGDGIDWTIWPTREQEQRFQLHRLQWMLPQAKAYYVSKDEKYAENWKEVLADWMKQNPCPAEKIEFGTYPENLPENHRNYGWTWRPLDAAARLNDLCAVVEYYQHSPAMTPEWLSEVYGYIAEHADHIMNNYSDDSNHLITQAQAVTFAGMLFPELRNHQAWRTSGTSTLATQIKAQYYDDGWLMDGDFHYHISAIPDFRTSLIVAQRNNAESYLPSDFVESMRKMTDVVKNMIYPDYSVVNMNDTRQTWTKSVLQRNLREYVEMFPDDGELQWLATEGRGEGSVKPESTIAVYPDCGFYVMRTGWEKEDMMMVLQNATEGPDKRWHRQWDNNTFEFYMNGRRFFMDSGCYSYGGTSETNAERRKYAASSAHNTITLNNGNVKSAGKMLGTGTGRTASTDYEWLSLENPSYENLTHRRTVFRVGKKFFVILDNAYGAAEGTVNLHIHATEGSDAEVVMDKGGFHTEFSDGNNIVVRTLKSSADEGSLVTRTGFLSKNINESVSRKAYSLNVAKNSDEDVVSFITLLMPSSEASDEIRIQSADFSEKGSNSVKVTIGDTTYTLTYKI